MNDLRLDCLMIFHLQEIEQKNFHFLDDVHMVFQVRLMDVHQLNYFPETYLLVFDQLVIQPEEFLHHQVDVEL
jgi:hypothetical protein